MESRMLSITAGTTTKKSSKEGMVDALPYIDSEYEDPGMKEMVMEMIEEEKRRYRPIRNYLEHLPPLELHRFETELMKKEYERMSQRTPMETLSMKRYELPPPPTGKLTDITAWTECLDNSFAQLEHQATRIANLDLMLEYGGEGWKSYLSVLTRMVAEAQKQLQTLKREIQELNWNRKSSQVNAGEAMQRLQNAWVGLVSKNYEIEQACHSKEYIKYEKEAELAQLKFIVTEAESDRSGSRIRRRVRRFFLQRRGPYGQNGQAEEKSDDEDEEEQEQVDAREEVPNTTVDNTSESQPMDAEEGQGESESGSGSSSKSDDGEGNNGVPDDADMGEEEDIGPQPYFFPDSDKIENDPERSAESDSDSNS